MTLTSPLNRFLSRPPRLFLWRSDGLRPGRSGNGPVFVVVSRGACRFKSFGEVEGNNPAQKRAALTLKVASWAPFPDAQHVSVAAAGRHMVWAWSQAEASAASAASGQRLGRARFVPECLFHEPLKEAVRLAACLDGVEGQVWNDGALAASRWWPEAPNQADWIAFQRSAGLKPDRMIAAVPRAVQPSWRERPWGGVDSSPLDMLRRLEPVEWAAAAAAVLLAPLVFLLAEDVRIGSRLSAVKSQITALQQSAGPIFDAQSKAFNAAERIRQLAALDPYPPQISIMARVASALPEDGTRIVDWSYQNGELTVAMTKPAGQVDATSYVRRFQDAGFSDINVDTANPQQLKVNLKVAPKR